MAYVKQTWENLPSTNTPITAERLNHMEDGIDEAWQHGGGGAGETLPIGSEIEFQGETTDIPEGWEYSEDDYNVYSTDEKVIGKWIDDKPLYRKVFNLSDYGTIQNGSTLAASIPNISDVTHQEYIYKYSNRYITFPLVESTGNTLHASYDASNQRIQFNGAGSWTARPMTAIIEYTKTTD